MQIKNIKRPWIREVKQGMRHNPDPWYHSREWKGTRQAFINSATRLPDGTMVSNALCIECYKQGRIVPMHTVDHIIQIKKGGSRTDHNNLQSLCSHHHAIKSANEANQK